LVYSTPKADQVRAAQENRGEMPIVSVVMPVHNALPFLDEAIESIIAQSVTDFEFIILDDASTDGSREKLREWQLRDPRIRIIEVDRNLGPAGSSQMVACEARARFVARMDADDISHPDRLQGQLDIFRAHPEAGIVACLCNFVDPKGVKLRQCEHWRLSRRSVLAPFAHGTIMYRRELFDRVGGYREQCLFWEDQDLIARIADEAPVFVIPRPLYSYRLSSSSTRIASNQDQLEHSVNLMFRSVERLKRQEPYDDLLREFVADGRKVSPRVFVSLGSQLLWAGGRPRMFRRILQRAKLRFDLNTILSATWTAWASASPSTLRTFLRLLVGLRNIIAHATHHSDDPVVWNSKPRLRTAALKRHRQITVPAGEEGLAIEGGFICEIGPVANLAYSERMASDAAA
jgi:glycosyltransferase involved in cell wall biosynthesis